jgi:hypothetical protein
MSDRYIATFQPQAWQNDYAIPVDPEGTTSWDCTAFVGEPANADYFDTETRQEIYEEIGGWVDKDDVLKGDPAAPQWIRDWQGPFTITVAHHSAHNIPEDIALELGMEHDEEGKLHCDQCGQEMEIGSDGEGVSHHLDDDGNIDHDQDADHVPFTTEAASE